MIEAHFDACNTEIWADEAETSNFEFCEKLPGGASALWRVSRQQATGVGFPP
jgi:hypothetical protein